MSSRFILPFADVGNGISPSDGAQLFFFETGTSTPKDTFSDSALTLANANPVVSDAEGVFGDIWLDSDKSYKVQLKDKNGVQSWEADPAGPKTSLPLASEVTYSQGDTGSVSRTAESRLQDFRTAKDFGATGGGTTDDSAAIGLANTAGDFVLTEGTYRISTNTTISSGMLVMPGAKFTIDTGITLTITGKMNAADTQLLFTGLGSVQFESGSINYATVMWFGAVPEDDSGSQPVDNVTACNNALTACDPATGGILHGDAAGSFRNIPVIVPPGMFSVDASAIDVPSYGIFKGVGDSSILACKAGSSSYTVVEVTTAGANSCEIGNFSIFGDQANQTGTIHGIGFNVASGGKPIYNKIIQPYIKEMSGNALRFVGSVNAENTTVWGGLFRDCKGHNIYINRANQLDFHGPVVRSAKTGSSGIVIDGTSNNNININDARVESNSQNGAYVTNTGGRIRINGGVYGTNGNNNIYFDRSDDSRISCSSEAAGNDGILIDQCDRVKVDVDERSAGRLGVHVSSSTSVTGELRISSAQQHGLYINASSDCRLIGHSKGNSQQTDNTYNGVHILGGSDNNQIAMLVRHGGGANQHKHGIEINDGASDKNWLVGSDLLNSGRTGTLLDNGTGTDTTSLVRIA